MSLSTYAYTSPHNPIYPEHASYQINFPDINLQKRLNELIWHYNSGTLATGSNLNPISVEWAEKAVSAHRPGLSLNLKNITNLEGLQYFKNLYGIYLVANSPSSGLNLAPLSVLNSKLRVLNLEKNAIEQDQFDTVVSQLTNLIQLIINSNKANNLDFLAGLTNLTDFRANTNPDIVDFTPVRRLSKLIQLELDSLPHLKQSDMAHIANFAHLKRLSLTGNSMYDLSGLSSHALTALNVSQQNVEYQVITDVFPNPIKHVDGTIIPIVETSDLINVDATGMPNANGGYIKILSTASAQTTWTSASHTNSVLRNFDGTIKIIYTPDMTPPTLTAPTSQFDGTTETVSFTITPATDHSGISHYTYTIEECDSNGTNCTTVVASTQIPSPLTSSVVTYGPTTKANTMYKFTLTATDTYNNTSAPQTVTQAIHVFTIDFQAGANGILNGTLSQTFYSGSVRTLVSVPNPLPASTYVFSGWSAPFPTLITGDAQFTALFSLIPTPPTPVLTSSSNNGGGGGGYVIYDHCPLGDASPSRYDGTCLAAPVPTPIVDADIYNTSIHDGYCYTRRVNAKITDSDRITTSHEFKKALTFLYSYDMTMFGSVEGFDPYRYLSRQEAAKIFSQFAINVLCRKPDLNLLINYTDVDNADPTLKPYIVLAYQLGLMKGSGLGDGEFRPFDFITKAEFNAVLIRMILKSYLTESADTLWYAHYNDVSHQLGIITQGAGLQSVSRNDISLMLFRAYKEQTFTLQHLGYESYVLKDRDRFIR